jgi:hypothetical protein
VALVSVTDEEAQTVAMACDIWARCGLGTRLPRFTVKDVKCGRWMDGTDRIVMPLWIWTGRWSGWPPVAHPHYLEWYVAHECAHYLHGVRGHGHGFQMVLGWLAGFDAWRWEETYKPRLYWQAVQIMHRANQNGISSSSMATSHIASMHAQASTACQPAHLRT